MKFKLEALESFSVIPNNYLRDKDLSLKAKGLLSTMYALPNEWDYSMAGLCKITNTGITSLRSTISELELKGYLIRKQQRNEQGKFEYIYYIQIKKKKVPLGNCTGLRRFKTALKNS